MLRACGEIKMKLREREKEENNLQLKPTDDGKGTKLKKNISKTI